jgi:hypothetical protein
VAGPIGPGAAEPSDVAGLTAPPESAGQTRSQLAEPCELAATPPELAAPPELAELTVPAASEKLARLAELAAPSGVSSRRKSPDRPIPASFPS